MFREDALKSLDQFVGINYRQSYEVAEGITLTFYDAGHILGSALVHLVIKEDEKIFTRILRRSWQTKSSNFKDPERIPNVDYFICESISMEEKLMKIH